MGSGTDVAKDTADIVLVDDRFETLEVAVQEDRRVFANLRRFGQVPFSWHVAEVIVITTAVVAGFPPPLAGPSSASSTPMSKLRGPLTSSARVPPWGSGLAGSR